MSIEQARQQAQDENTAPEILAELANSEDYQTREYVASNPNTAIKTLEQLGEEFPEAITDNPIFNLLFLENPQSNFVQLSLARSSTTSEAQLDQLAIIINQSTSFYMALAVNPNTSAKALDIIITNFTSPNICKSVLLNTKTSLLTLKKIVFNRFSEAFLFDREYYKLLVEHPNISPTLVQVLDFIDGSKDTPAELLYELIKFNTGYNKKAFAHPNMSVAVLEKLSFDSRVDIRSEVAIHPKTLELTLSHLIKDSSEYVRSQIACRQDLSEKMALTLSQDSSKHVRCQIACRQDLSEKIALTLSQDSCQIVLKVLIVNPCISSNILEILLSHIYRYEPLNLIQEIDLCPSCRGIDTWDEVTNIINDDCIYKHGKKKFFAFKNRKKEIEITSSLIKEKIVNHPSTTVKILNKLKNAKYSNVREAVASSNKISPLIIKYLSQDVSCKVRRKIAQNKLISPDILNNLKYDKCIEVRQAIASNPNTPLAMLRELLYDKNEIVVKNAMNSLNSCKNS